MQGTGLLVTSWPIVLGCDASGTITEVGPNVNALKVGDRVCGCTRLGMPGHSTFQEYFLMDAPLALPIPAQFSYEQGATLGVGTYTASLGLFQGLKLALPKPDEPLPQAKEEWVVVLGGAGSVGQYSVQIAKALGYKVVASCSHKTAEMVRALGADEVIDYRKSEDEQLSDLKAATGGNFFGVYDTVARSDKWASRALVEVSAAERKLFATTDDWTPMEPKKEYETWRAKLGLIGRSAEERKDIPTLNSDLASYIPLLTRLINEQKLKPNELKVVGKGFESVAEAVGIQQRGGAGGSKVVVDLQQSSDP